MPPRRVTPWASHTSLPSDRIRPSPSQPANPEKGKGKGKGKGKAMAAVAPEPPRSAVVRGLDEPLAGLNSSESTQPSHNKSSQKATTATGTGPQADPREGCFCQARVHALSEHTPLCTACGLVLCAFTPATPPLPTLRWAAPHPAHACGAHRAAGGAARPDACGGGRGAREGGGGGAPCRGRVPHSRPFSSSPSTTSSSWPGAVRRPPAVDTACSRSIRARVASWSTRIRVFLTSGATLMLPGHGSESEEEAAAVFYAPSSGVPPPSERSRVRACAAWACDTLGGFEGRRIALKLGH
ncbi:hypothetical protein F5148DRAFT_1368572 [Russula earlei]|uniref:Uncharacterized protein n=1 Tax=Russula earlei TaxID=71964 RepID=A0ACC0U6B7_9AGAM|nr:hypothetical protein F5148DRAFT_1368572 [Russula earlei]